MKVYCSTCGSGTNYTMTKPKFCSSCGGSFSALAKTLPKRVFKANPQNPAVTIQEEVEEEFEMPNIDKLEVEINVAKSFGIMSLKDLAVGEAQQNDGYMRETDPTYSKKSFEEDFRRDAGSSRNHERTQET